MQLSAKRACKKQTADQYYVYLIANQAVNGAHDLTNAAKTRIIDSRSFYVSNKQQGDVPVSYTAKVSNKLYTGDDYADDVEVKVDVTFRNGVVLKDQAATGLSLDGGFKVAGNKISKGTMKGDGTATVSVYLATVDGLADDGKTKKVYKNDGAVATCTLTYSDDDPVGTSIDFKRTVQNNAATCENYGTTWTEDETETVWDLPAGTLVAPLTSAITVKNGVLTMDHGNVADDTYTMTVKDQYGTAMTNAKYYINGTEVSAVTNPVAPQTNTQVLEIKGQSKGSEVSKTWRVNVPVNTIVTAVDNSDPEPVGTASTDDPAKLVNILTAAAANGVADEITFTGINAATAGTTVGAGDTLVIASGATLTLTNGNELTVNAGGNLKNNGIMNYATHPLNVADGTTFTNNGTISNVTTLGVGTAATTATFKNTGKITLTGDTTVNGTVTNSGTFDATGHDIIVNDGASFTNEAGGTVTCKDANGAGTFTNKGTVTATGTINMFKKNTFHNSGTVTAANISGYFQIESSSAKTTATGTYTATTIVPAGEKAKIVIGSETLTIDNSGEGSTAEVGVVDNKTVTVIEGNAKVTSTAGDVTEKSLDAVLASGFTVDGTTVGNDLDTAYGKLTSPGAKAYTATDFNGVKEASTAWLLYTAPAAKNMVFVSETTIGGKTYTWYEVGGSPKTAGSVFAYAESIKKAYLASNGNAIVPGYADNTASTAALNAAGTAMDGAYADGFTVTVKVYAADAYADANAATLVGSTEIECKAPAEG